MSDRASWWRRSAFEARRWWRDERAARRAVVHPRPIFVLGMQKSGTSAIAALLGLRTGIEPTIDLERDWRRTTVDGAGRDAIAFERFVRRNAVDFARSIIKEPNLTFLVDRLRDRWPEAPLVFVVRDPAETIRSILDRLDLPGDGDVFPAEGLAAIPAAWRVVLDNRWIGVGATHPIDSLAGRWRVAAEVAVAQSDAIVVRYEDFLADKSAVIDDLAARLDLPIVAPIEAHLDRPFQPRGRPRSPREVFGANLERLWNAAGPVAETLGYRP